MITNFLFLFGPLLSGVWWGRVDVRHTWSCGGESPPEKAGVDQWWLMGAPGPLIGHPRPVLAPHWLAVSTGTAWSPLATEYWISAPGSGRCSSLRGRGRLLWLTAQCLWRLCSHQAVSRAMVTNTVNTIVTMETPAGRDSLGLDHNVSTVKLAGGQSPVYTEVPHSLPSYKYKVSS